MTLAGGGYKEAALLPSDSLLTPLHEQRYDYRFVIFRVRQ